MKRLRQCNQRLNCHNCAFYRRCKRINKWLLTEISVTPTLPEAVTPAVLPVNVEPSSVNTDSMTIETEVVPSPPCRSLTPAASTSKMCPKVSFGRDEIITGCKIIMQIFHERWPQLPTTMRGILRMCDSRVSRLVGDGINCHIGLLKCLQHHAEMSPNEDSHKKVNLDSNVDGLSISKSSNQQLSPLLGRVIAPFLSSVFLIGIYGGPSKPELIASTVDIPVFNDKRTNETNERKTYAVLTKPDGKEFFLAARKWMASDEMCVYHSSVTESEVEACIMPRPYWFMISCQMLAETDSFLEAKTTLSAVLRMHSIMARSDNPEKTKRERVETKDCDSYVDSAELEAMEAQRVFWSSKYPKTNFMDTVMLPTAR
ncbi:unnamed protein product [Trichobilharzia szidati]|nr:unnamed protein product [Trichobilharzia szidati]